MHVKVLHQEIREYKCKLCDKWFTLCGNLQEHIATKHMGLTAKEFRNHPDKTRYKKYQEHRQMVKNHEAFEYIPSKTLLEIAKELNVES